MSDRLVELVRDMTWRQAKLREQRVAAFVTALPRHEQVRVVREVGPGVAGGMVERLRVRSWSEVSFTEVSRVLQGLTLHGVPAGRSQFHDSETFGIDTGNAMGVE